MHSLCKHQCAFNAWSLRLGVGKASRGRTGIGETRVAAVMGGGGVGDISGQLGEILKSYRQYSCCNLNQIGGIYKSLLIDLWFLIGANGFNQGTRSQ